MNCKLIISTLTLVITLSYTHKQSYSEEAVTWKELKGEHFIIYYIQDEKFANEVLKNAEAYYKRIANELGYQRYSNFWLWENRARIYIYPNHKTYIHATGQPEWSNGVASYYNRTVTTYVWSEGFINALLPHELAHLIFRDFVGFKGEVPLWLDEGVAQWMEVEKRNIAPMLVKNLLKEGIFIPLETLTKLDIRGHEDKKLVETFYIESIALVDFLIKKRGMENFIAFCRQLRDGKKLNDALRFAYPSDFRSIEELGNKWIEYIRR